MTESLEAPSNILLSAATVTRVFCGPWLLLISLFLITVLILSIILVSSSSWFQLRMHIFFFVCLFSTLHILSDTESTDPLNLHLLLFGD